MKTIGKAVWKQAAFSFCVMILSGCVSSLETMKQMVTGDGGVYSTPLAGDFYLFRVTQKGQPSSIAHIFIEGDGQAWLSRYRPADDPTPSPSKAIGYQIARTFKGSWAYLARPCQFVPDHKKRNCTPPMWTNARYAPEVVRSTSIAIDQIKRSLGAKEIYLYGYSGGGTLATLIAGERRDVAFLTTVASPLDIDAWSAHHDMSKLRYSVNPTSKAKGWVKTPQIHYVGGKDDIVPPSLNKATLQKLGLSLKETLRLIPSYDHECCWSKLKIQQ